MRLECIRNISEAKQSSSEGGLGVHGQGSGDGISNILDTNDDSMFDDRIIYSITYNVR